MKNTWTDRSILSMKSRKVSKIISGRYIFKKIQKTRSLTSYLKNKYFLLLSFEKYRKKLRNTYKSIRLKKCLHKVDDIPSGLGNFAVFKANNSSDFRIFTTSLTRTLSLEVDWKFQILTNPRVPRIASMVITTMSSTRVIPFWEKRYLLPVLPLLLWDILHDNY